ncbi:MAG: hypothetical protein OEZ68_13325 [Gammaproteobacteria bacterium]|nr:hypothetical protein [Gammaproteobacteria bacterium]MDH5801781.1 hypothetical protein [Gammaproteobacteria bacterium]
MKFLDSNDGLIDADSADDAAVSLEKLKARLADLLQQVKNLPQSESQENQLQRAQLQLQCGGILVDLERGEEAFEIAREAFDTYAALAEWDGAVQCCDVMFQADQPDSLAALGQGVWLAVTFPINPDITVNMLNHIVDETPADSDGAAVAAAVAKYVVDVRAKGKSHENLSFFTNNMLGGVARRHSDVNTQEQFDYWIEKLELNDPAKFLPRLRNVVDVMVQEDWWVDREAIWASLPDQ